MIRKDLCELLMDRYPVIKVVVAVGMPGVDVPMGAADGPAIEFHLGYAMEVPIPDLSVTDQGISATLSFGRTPHTVQFPWNSIVAMHPVFLPDGEDMPIMQFAGEAGALVQKALEAAKPATPAGIREPPGLRLVKDND